ncbi:MAG: glutamine amidotransferase [Solirubrobacterales bacterium]|jgi:transcriptional regulator GlxA family with amidase domain|nr:glutamine amidotransferase [Solirubrobacterales bacterium]
MQIAVLLYDRFTALDAIGPYEVLSRLPDAEVVFVAAEPGPVSTDTRRLTIVAERSLDEVPHPDILLIPGGPGEDVLREEPLLDWVRAVHETTTWTTSVCTGSLVLARAGLLDAKRATSHWLALERLRELGAEPVEERIVEEGKIVTAAGVSAGIDMALHLAGRIAGEEVAQSIQLYIEYDPDPPFDAGSPAKAPRELVERTRARSRFFAAG